METSEQNARIAALEQALKAVNEVVQAATNENVELRVHVHALVQNALLKPGEVPIYGRALPWFIKADSEGTQVFYVKANAEAFKTLLLREYPSEGYGTRVTLRLNGIAGPGWAVDYVIGSAE